jgi:hypothetical protein
MSQRRDAVMSHDMRLGGATVAVALMLCVSGGYAESDLKPPSQTAAEISTKANETLKERLSDKASDEQRVDNCKVPLDRRGTTRRPKGCKLDDARAAPVKQP